MADRVPPERRLDAVGVGPQRTATSWLHACLAEHPGFLLPRRVKETFFFDRHFERGWDWYWDHFAEDFPGALRIEIAPTLFHRRGAMSRLREHNPACRIVVGLRDPAGRSLSLWLHHRRKGRVGPDFDEAAARHPEILEASRYSVHLPRWIGTFGRERIHLLPVEEVADRPGRALDDLYRFLGVDPPDRRPDGLRRRVYPGEIPRSAALARVAAGVAGWLRGRGIHVPLELARKTGLRAAVLGGGGVPEPDPSLRARLVETFREDVRYVEELLGRELPAWRHA